MDVEVCIEKDLLKPKLVIHTKEITPEISELIKKLTDYNEHLIIGYTENEVVLIRIEEIYRIYTQGSKVLVQLEKETARLKLRLYELEERLIGTELIRISNSEFVNLSKVKSLDLSISGTITMKLKNGDKSFVSRRYIDKIKNIIGM